MQVKNKIMASLSIFLEKIAKAFKRLWNCYKTQYQKALWYKKIGIIIGTFFVFIFTYFFAVYFNLFWLFGKSPSMHSIMNPRNSEASLLFSEDSVLLGKYFSENRTPVVYEEVNPMFYQTLIDTEDERFYEHHGVDFMGVGAAMKDMLKGEARGASTITQQLVKNMFRVRTQYSTGILGKIPGIKMLIMKTKEWMLALQIEAFYSKKEILQMYVNTVDFGSNAYGIKTAAKTYFNTTPNKLSIEEGATLVGLLKATTTYNPKLNPKRSLARRNVVLKKLAQHKHISLAMYDSLSRLPLRLNYNVETAYDGQALYFRQIVADFLKKWCKENDIDLYTDGLKIYTTVNSKLQLYAEEAVRKQMQIVQRNFNAHWGKEEPWQDEKRNPLPHFVMDLAKKTPVYRYLTQRYVQHPDSVLYYLNLPHAVKVFDYDKGEKIVELSTLDSIRYMTRFMHTGFVAMEPQTGYIKAWVGDLNYKWWKYDKANAKHQPGSTFKLFVYAEAMNQGLTPCDYRKDEYISMPIQTAQGKDTVWRPHNADGTFFNDDIPLRAAFARSINTIAVKLGQEVGIKKVAETAHRMGIKSKLSTIPALALGASDVNVCELVNAYCTVANNGIHAEPVFVTKIEDRDGNIIYEAEIERKEVLTPRTAFFMQQLLMAGMRDAGGTSQSLWGYVGKYASQVDFGGKTGTSNNHADAWFIGVTPSLVAGAWVGGEYRQIHFRTGTLGQGSRTALPIFGYFMDKVLSDSQFSIYKKKFTKPQSGISYNEYACSYTPIVTDTIAEDSLQEEQPSPVEENNETTTEHLNLIPNI